MSCSRHRKTLKVCSFIIWIKKKIKNSFTAKESLQKIENRRKLWKCNETIYEYNGIKKIIRERLCIKYTLENIYTVNIYLHYNDKNAIKKFINKII